MLFATFVRGQRLSVFYAAFSEPPAAGTSPGICRDHSGTTPVGDANALGTFSSL